jgi:hypothetical protein
MAGLDPAMTRRENSRAMKRPPQFTRMQVWERGRQE